MNELIDDNTDDSKSEYDFESEYDQIKTYDVFEYNLTFEQISNLEYYKNILDLCDYMEEWEYYEGYYISSLGRVKLKDGRLSDRKTHVDGYITFNNEKIHRLVAKLFIENNDESRNIVDHINGIRHDNRVCNLRWVTQKENMNNCNFKNKTNSFNRIIYQYDRFGNFIKEWRSSNEISDFYCVKGIHKHLDNYKEYKGYYWFRKPEELLEGEIFKELFIEEINRKINISNKGRFLRYNNSISNGSLNKFGYISIFINDKKFNIHRLVMMAFNPIDNYKEMVVDHIDGNKSNNNLENLRWCTYAENTQFYHINNDKDGHKNTMRSVIVTYVNYENYSFEYKYNSIVEASKNIGFSNSQLKRILSSKNKTEYLQDNRGIFYIRYEIEVVKLKKEINKIAVNQFDMNGNYIKTHDSLTKAANSIGVDNPSNITLCCKGKNKSAYGYLWRYVDESNINKKKTILQFSLEGTYIGEYESSAEAGRKTDIDNSNIIKSCKFQNHSAGGFIWRYKE